MQIKFWSFVIGFVCSAVVALADPVVNLGHYTFAENSSHSVPFLVTDSGNAATEDIEGMTFTLQIASGTGTMPSVTAIDFLTSTIWTGHVSAANITAAAGGTEPQFQSYSLITDNAGDFVNANGTLANITFDTTNATPGDYSLKLIGTTDPGSDSQFTDGVGDPVTATFGSGTLTVTTVPEPAALGVIALAVLPLLRRPPVDTKP